MVRWDVDNVRRFLSSFPGRKVAVVRGRLTALALYSLVRDIDSVDIVYLDTWLDFPWLRTFLLSLVTSHERGSVHTPTPPYIFFRYILSDGYPPPSESFRWHTRRLVVDPVRRLAVNGGYSAVVFYTASFELPENKLLNSLLTVNDLGVGVGRVSGIGIPLLFPFAAARRSDVYGLFREVCRPPLCSLLSKAPRGECWLCNFPHYDEHARFADDLGLYGADVIGVFRTRFLLGASNPENRVVDESGYVRSLNLSYRLWFYSMYQTIATRLNYSVPGYLPVLPPAEEFGLYL